MEWFESTDTNGVFNTVSQIDNTQNVVYAITVNDFDNDGDLDIATVDYQSSHLNWFENILETLSIEELTIEAITIYPNPTKDILNFRGLSNDNNKVAIYDILGKNLLNTEINTSNNIVDVSTFNSGGLSDSICREKYKF